MKEATKQPLEVKLDRRDYESDLWELRRGETLIGVIYEQEEAESIAARDAAFDALLSAAKIGLARMESLGERDHVDCGCGYCVLRAAISLAEKGETNET